MELKQLPIMGNSFKNVRRLAENTIFATIKMFNSWLISQVVCLRAHK